MDNNYYQHPGYYGNNPEPEKAPNIFQQFVLAFIPTQYSRLTKVRTGSMIGFVTLLALLATILSFVSVAFSFSAISGGGWADAIPEFKVADGRLYIDGDFEFDEGGTYVYITDEISGFTYDAASQIEARGITILF